MPLRELEQPALLSLLLRPLTPGGRLDGDSPTLARAARGAVVCFAANR